MCHINDMFFFSGTEHMFRFETFCRHRGSSGKCLHPASAAKSSPSSSHHLAPNCSLHDSLSALIGFLLELLSLLLAGLEKESNPVGVVVHGEVREPGAGVGVHHNLVAPLHVQNDVLASHGVLVVSLWFWSKMEAISSPFFLMLS